MESSWPIIVQQVAESYDITTLFTCAMTDVSMLLSNNLGDKKIWELINCLKSASLVADQDLEKKERPVPRKKFSSGPRH